MNYSAALEQALERFRQGQPSKLVHPFLPMALTISRDGAIRVGPFSLGMTIEQFANTKLWRLEQ